MPLRQPVVPQHLEHLVWSGRASFRVQIYLNLVGSITRLNLLGLARQFSPSFYATRGRQVL